MDNKKTNKSRKDNPDYEKHVVHTRDGVKQTVYKKKDTAKKPKKNQGTPDGKKRGAFKKPKNVGLMDSKPASASSMAKPIGNYQMEQSQKQASANMEYTNMLSDSKREKVQNQFKAPKQVAMAKSRSRTNPNA
jgi:hypothetical protein